MLWTTLIQPAGLLEAGGQEESHGSDGHDRIGSR
jgi:hypothetical protein